MNGLNEVLLIVHFLGLGLGFSASFGNMVMGGIIAKAEPSEKALFGRIPPLLSRLGIIGLACLWATGLTLGYTRWAYFQAMPWQFWAKLTSVGLLTIAVAYIHRLEHRAGGIDEAAIGRIASVGKAAMVFAIVAVVFAVLTFH